jgi:glutamate/tyrosine decarboxylase-like PLP-dependent enzyme
MNTRLDQLRDELAAPLPHPDVESLRAFSNETLEWLLKDFATLPQQSIGRAASRREMEELLREPPPQKGSDFSRVLAEFRNKIVPNAFRINHPRFLAFIPAGPSFVSVLADWLCSATNFFSGVWLEASAPSQVELIVLDWFKEFLGYPAEASGILTSGGSEANMTALVVARDRSPPEERRRAVLYITEQRHGSVDRAARIIGILPDQLRPAAADAGYRLYLPALADAVASDRRAGRLPWAVVANAGSTNTGTIDPLAGLAELCRRENLWLHVDAAYGWPAVLVDEEKAAFAGIALADSITLDPHKWFAQPYEAGCVLIREGKRLSQTFRIRPDYMQDVEPASDEINFADQSLALTRRFRALKIWFSIKVLGVEWFRGLVARSCRLAELAQMLLEKSPNFKVISPRQLSVVCFRYVPESFGRQCSEDEESLNRLNLAIVDAARDSGKAFPSSTKLNGQVALRLCFVSWRTTSSDVEAAIELLQELGGQLTMIGAWKAKS